MHSDLLIIHGRDELGGSSVMFATIPRFHRFEAKQFASTDESKEDERVNNPSLYSPSEGPS